MNASAPHNGKHDNKYDAVILGGALTGTVLYIALAEIFAKQKKSLIILERESRPIPDNRMLSLGYAGGSLLRKFGLWDEIEKYVCPVTSLEINYTGKDKSSFVLEADDLGLPALGWTIPHQKLQNVFWDKVNELQQRHSGLDMAVPFTMESIDIGNDVASIKGESRNIKSDLIFAATGGAPLPLKQGSINYHHYVDADTGGGGGKNSEGARGAVFAVASVRLKNYKQSRGYWFGGSSSDSTAVALTPSASTLNQQDAATGVYVAIVSLPRSSHSSHLRDDKFSQEQFAEIIMNCTNIRDLEVAEDPVVYKASSYIALDRVFGPLVLIGNAAHSVAPLGGQNYNLTLWTIDKLRDKIIQHLDAGRDFTNREFLVDFVSETDIEIRRGQGIVHHLDNLLSGEGVISDKLPEGILSRETLINACMQTLDNSPPLRNKIFARAAGLHRIR